MMSSSSYPAWHPVVHHSLVLCFLLTMVLLPILYIRTRQPPYWVLLVVLCAFVVIYTSYWVSKIKDSDSTKSHPDSSSGYALYINGPKQQTTKLNHQRLLSNRLWVFRLIHCLRLRSTNNEHPYRPTDQAVVLHRLIIRHLTILSLNCLQHLHRLRIIPIKKKMMIIHNKQ